MKLIYPAYILKNSDGTYTIDVPDLPGCVSFGNDMADAIIMGIDAASGWILDELEEGKRIPTSTPIGDLDDKEDTVKTILALDMDTYTEKYGNKAVRKNLTIPAWLNTFAEKSGINFSEVLQDSLKTLYLKEDSG